MTSVEFPGGSSTGGGDTSLRKVRRWIRDDNHPHTFARQIRQPVQLFYQQYIVEFLLRQKPLPPSRAGRHVPLRVHHETALIDERREHAYLSNTIRSSRYTLWDFLPKQLFFQVTRVHNFYFLCIGIPQTIPGLSTTGNYTTILPLMFFILLTVVKEGYDDYHRHRMDKIENNKMAQVLCPTGGAVVGGEEKRKQNLSALRVGNLTNLPRSPWTGKSNAQPVVEEVVELDRDEEYAWTDKKWHDIKVGDIVRLKRDDAVPADLVLLHADGENGVAYIETMALDGETNLKSRQAVPLLQQRCGAIDQLKTCSAEFVLEDPNKDLYEFNGKVTVDEKTMPLTLNEILFRGTVLRNTGRAIGIVVNTGEECKIRMNANHHPTAKKPRLEKYANQVVLTLICYVVSLSVGTSMGYLLWHDRFEVRAWYLKKAYPQFKQIIVGFLIMFNNIIPLALYVSLEIVKIGQRLMVQGDVEMYDEETNTPMSCNTNTILVRKVQASE